MATSTEEPTRGAPPSDVLSPHEGRSARALLARPQSARTRSFRVLILVIGVGVLVGGWMVTDIDLGKLTNASNAGPILRSLLQPDVVARDQTPTELDVPFIVAAGSNGPASASTPAGQTL